MQLLPKITVPREPAPAPTGAPGRPGAFPGRRRQAGSIIVLVLVMVLLAAALLTKFVERSGTEMLADSRAANQARLRREAYSALEVTLAVLADFRTIDNGLFSAAQGWDQPFAYADYTPSEGRTVDVAFEDESGKISLPRANLITIENLLVMLGVETTKAEQVADALLAWTRTDYSPISPDVGASAYDRGDLPYHPPQRPLRSFAELAAVKYARELFFDADGRLNALGRQFAANVSLYSFDKVNLNSTSPAVLAAGGLESSQIDGLKDYAQQQQRAGAPPYFKSVGDAAAVVGSAPMQAYGTAVRALRITVTVHDGAAVYRMSAVVAPPGGAVVAPTPTQAPNPATEAGNISSATASTPETLPAVIKKLDYPFKVLEIQEDLESIPTPPPDSTAND